MGKFAVILPAAGRSTRFGDSKQKKIYAELEGRAVWLRAAEPFVNRDDVAQIVMAIASEDREIFERRYRPSVAFMNIKIIEGGEERCDTVARALEVVDPACEFIAVHDAARPCLSTLLIDAVFAAARAHGAALPATPVAETIKRARVGQFSSETVPREGTLPGSDAASVRAKPALPGVRPALANRGPRYRRLPACRGSGASLRPSSRARRRQHQDHHRTGSQAGGCVSAAPGEAQARESGSPVPEDEQAMWGGLPKLKPSWTSSARLSSGQAHVTWAARRALTRAWAPWPRPRFDSHAGSGEDNRA